MREVWQGTLVVKGILSTADAARAREIGEDGIILSYHGCRQLDYAVPPIRVLQGVLKEARGMTVMANSGFRRGTDIVKALALGAHSVFIGRPFLYAAVCAGMDGSLTPSRCWRKSWTATWPCSACGISTK